MAGIHHGLILILSLAAGYPAAIVQVFRESVISTEGQPAAEASGEVGLQGVIAGDPLHVPKIGTPQILIGPRPVRKILRSLRHTGISRRRRACAYSWPKTTGQATVRVRANLRHYGVRINVDDVMVRVGAHIADANRHVLGQLLLDEIVPLHHRRSLRVDLSSPRGYFGAGYGWECWWV